VRNVSRKAQGRKVGIVAAYGIALTAEFIKRDEAISASIRLYRMMDIPPTQALCPICLKNLALFSNKAGETADAARQAMPDRRAKAPIALQPSNDRGKSGGADAANRFGPRLEVSNSRQSGKWRSGL
jgi:hypothetical protein